MDICPPFISGLNDLRWLQPMHRSTACPQTCRLESLNNESTSTQGMWNLKYCKTLSVKRGLRPLVDNPCNPIIFATLGSANCPGKAETLKSHTDPSIRSNEEKAFAIE